MYIKNCFNKQKLNAGYLPVNVALAAWNNPHIGHSQHLLSNGLAGGVSCCHGDGLGGLIHAQELT